MKEIISYLIEKYHPLTIICYGSYANGTNNQHSDFDALVVADCEGAHDTSVVTGVQLDVFVYPPSALGPDADARQFVQIFDGNVVLDTGGIGEELKARALAYLHSRPQKTDTEILQNLQWCKKMMARTQRGDIEGLFRWHWLLVDSLEIACDLLHHPYLGPKKSLIWLKENSPALFETYRTALEKPDRSSLERWVTCLEQTYQEREANT